MVETDLLLCVSINDEASLYIYICIYILFIDQICECGMCYEQKIYKFEYVR